MAHSAVVAARIHEALSDRLEKVVTAYDRSRGWVIARALERYLDEEIALIDSLAVAAADSAAGRVFSQEQIEAMFEIKRAERNTA